MKVIAVNKHANRLYNIEEKLEAGIQLIGDEVKSIRQGGISIKEGYARISNNELFLYNVNISAYKNSSLKNYDPKRKRKLLVHKNQIKRMIGKQQERGYTIVPLKAYFKKHLVKIEIGIGKGKTKIDKRQDIKKREDNVAIERAMKKNLHKNIKLSK